MHVHRAYGERVRSAYFPLVLTLLLPACVMPTTPTDKLMDAAYDHNVAARFGRMDIAQELVAASAQKQWAQAHAAWGSRVRIVDLELQSMQLRSRDEADVRVLVSWQRSDEADLRTTELAQKWRSKGAGWQLDQEECAGGDDALLAPTKEPSK